MVRHAKEESVVSTQLAEYVTEEVKPTGWTGKNVFYLSMENIMLVPGKKSHCQNYCLFPFPIKPNAYSSPERHTLDLILHTLHHHGI